jgi:hypothetical protein
MRRRGKSRPRFLSLHHRLLRSHAWHTLTPLQRAGYIEIAQLYDGSNNGRLAMSARRLAGLIPCAKNSDVLRALKDAGFIETVKVGRYAKKEEERLASEYRLTDHRCDVTGELPSRRYNPRHLWDPSTPKPKRKALTVAERVRRHRKRRNACNGERPNHWDGIVPIIGTVSVTCGAEPSSQSPKTAKNDPRKSTDVTLSVPTTGTLIHLTRGTGPLEGTRRGELGGKPLKPPFAVSLAPGHDFCKMPKINSLPPAWHWCRFEKSVVTDTGVVVPVVDHPLVGTSEGREAVAFLAQWNRARNNVVPLRNRCRQTALTRPLRSKTTAKL